MKIIFLGTNGWFSTETGNTACVVCETDDYYAVFDAGDGIAKLDKYVTSGKPIYLFLSHFHLDHIIGLHTLNKFKFEQGLSIHGQKGTRKILQDILRHPFTLPMKNLPLKVAIKELSEGDHRVPCSVTCKYLVHADPCYGYRIMAEGKAVTYCTDTGICDNSLQLARNADILIHDCGENSARRYREWPHTSPAEAAELARKANVKKLILFHFSPAIYTSAEDRKKAEWEAKEVFPNTVAAMDGMEIEIK